MPAQVGVEDRSAERTAHELVSRVEHAVRSRTGGRVRNLRVEVHEDDVVLHGVASNYYTKQLATHAVFAEAPDRVLANEIDVVAAR